MLTAEHIDNMRIVQKLGGDSLIGESRSSLASSWIVSTNPQDDLLDHFSDILRAVRLAHGATVHEKHFGLHTLVVSW